MAHHRREHLVPELVERIGIRDDQVAWDRSNDRWDTGRRAWEMRNPDADFHVVLQDDALVCDDFIAGLSVALDHVPPNCIVQPFLGVGREKRGYRNAKRAAIRATETGKSWIIMPALMWGVAIVAPTHTIPAMLDWCDQLDYPEYDRRVGQYYWRQLRWYVWHTHPSLVDHRADVPSLADHGPGIVAHDFLREGSALDVDFSRGAIEAAGVRSSLRAGGSSRYAMIRR